LEKFEDKFKKELADVEAEESNQAHNFDLELIHLSDTIAYLKKEHEEKSVLKAKRASESAAGRSELADTKADLAEDQTTLKDMKATFAAKSDQFKANQEVRKQELEAIGKAVEIIADPSVAASYGKHINLVQKTGKSTFLQLRSVRQRVTSRDRVSQFLAKKGQALSSEMLKNLAKEVASNPFNKVFKFLPKTIEMSQIKVLKNGEEQASEGMMMQSMVNIQFEQAKKMFKEVPIPIGDIVKKNPPELQCFGFNIGDIGLDYKKSQMQFTTYYKHIENPDPAICDNFLE
jgi:hypothetical protein